MRSDNVTKGAERAPNRSLFYALGYTPEDLRKPLIAAAPPLWCPPSACVTASPWAMWA